MGNAAIKSFLHNIHISMMCASWSANGIWDFNTIFMIPLFAVFALNHPTFFWLTTFAVYSKFHVSNILFLSFFAAGRGMG